ncbi:HAD hydrolase-like protein [Chitinophaga nivalis]|uniref:HAD hydrolase-like protein n=1 Tax=Chitinophaga nivalis TaxID=2991709 RepID=A0ABT3ISJ7_9BACT|nr:HAD hydrolase-like protein [Chitinophaga nivalis]MCW3463353.1 HAD hydrolase-like protein [Chitinophaga nivalis]MCW3486957.1 HAD hydrolase-like protein [Chitinophaga nivalis]
MGIQLAVFDIAGTTLHDESNVALVLQQTLQLAGVSVTIAEVNEVMGYAKPYAIRYLLQQKQNNRYNDEAYVQELHTRFVTDMKAHYADHPAIREKEGVSAVFAALQQRGIKVALDTGFDREITNVILERVGWVKQGLVNAVATSDEVTYGRPYPYMIYRIMQELEICSIDTVAKIGDTVSDLEEGTNAGCRYVVGVTTGAYTREELAKGPHTHLVANLDELLNIF